MTGTTQGLCVGFCIGTTLGQGHDMVTNGGTHDEAELETLHAQGGFLEETGAKMLQGQAPNAWRGTESEPGGPGRAGGTDPRGQNRHVSVTGSRETS
jgi:hypothetical protein